ncbi:MAG: branched-chain amino acid ABC transporter permease [Anaerolineaceae bacterium]|nr:branched-chain amino acid ABC transporter permease [Anaerolineaceae bacterium]
MKRNIKILQKLDIKKIVLGGLILAALIAIPQIFRSPFMHHVMTMMCIWAIVGMGWNVIGGYTGQVSNGHALYYGIGAYTCALSMKWFSLSPWVAMWIGAIISGTLAFFIGKPLLRFRGPIFAIATMAIAESGRLAFVNMKAIGGATGVYFFNSANPPIASMQFRNSFIYFYVYLAFTLLVLLLIKLLDKTKFFYYLRAIRGNEQAAASIGIDTGKYKILAYMLSAAIVSLGGSLYAQFVLYIDPLTLMTLNVSMMIVLVAVMGGVGTVIGPLIGAVVLTFISEYTRVYLGKYGGLDMILYGVLVILIILFLPKGLISLKETILKKRNNTEKVIQ